MKIKIKKQITFRLNLNLAKYAKNKIEIAEELHRDKADEVLKGGYVC